MIKRYPNSASVQSLHGLLLLAQGDFSHARSALERAVTIDKNGIEASSGLAALDLAMRDFASAKRRVRALVDASPKRLDVLLLSARVHMAAGDGATAEQDLRRALDVDPNAFPAYVMLGRLYISQQKLDAARAEFEALASRQPKPVAALSMAGTILQAQGNLALARERFEQVMAIDQNAPLAANNLAWIYADSGENLDDALRLARIARTGLPDVAEVSDTLGWVYYKRKQPADAVTAFSESVTKNPKNAVYQYHLGLAHLQAGDTGKGRAALTRALSLNPKFAGAEEAKRLLDGSGSERP
jgi:Tfp pilus assembly protein PilF